VSVPLLKITARDDFLVFGQFARKLNHCLENPNVVVVKTRCGGHLGWQESPPPSKDGTRAGIWGGRSGSWSDVAVADFIEALLQVREEDRKKSAGEMNTFGESSPPKVLSKL
jgi:predicted alpha/beta-fold hydrolase